MSQEIEEKCMDTVVLLFDSCCIYEIAALNYFLNFAGKHVIFASIDGEAVTSMEGYSINVNNKLSDVDAGNTELLIVPGGNIREIDTPLVWDFIKQVRENDQVIAGICAGVDVLDHAGILDGILSTHSSGLDVAVTEKVITSRANGYVDFAIEVAKRMDLFKDEADLRETIEFWKNHQRMQ